MATQVKPVAAERPIVPTIVRSLEPVDVEGFLLRYARAIVEVAGSGPVVPPSTPSQAA